MAFSHILPLVQVAHDLLEEPHFQLLLRPDVRAVAGDEVGRARLVRPLQQLSVQQQRVGCLRVVFTVQVQIP
uniref:Uncharacterized protein n=1 Tax=Anguilla anguilla TaxID=7936 RepID=A0A0E9P6N3_ANGAN